MQIKEISKKIPNTMAAEKYDELLKKVRREHDKPVKGMFEFLDAQGGWLDFAYRFFKGEPLTTIRLTHGEICELPMGIVKHLNNTKKKIRKFALNAKVGSGMEIADSLRGIPQSYEVQSRLRFTPVDVM